MKWLEVRLDTRHEGLSAVETFLSVQGIDSIVIDDEAEFLQFAAENRAQWDQADEALRAREQGKCRVSFYLPAGEDGLSRLAAVRLALSAFRRDHPECEPLLMTLENLRESDWENNWKQYYHAAPVGRRLLIVPRWERPETDGRIPLYLDPGVTFGTGSHATTRLCLELLERQLRPGARVLDLGCGSGILSIAALRLGAGSAFACDIDEMCRAVAYENAALNGIGEETLTVRCGDVLSNAALRREIGGGYDVVLANIVADVIVPLAPFARSVLGEDGVFITSGILSERAAEVADALRLAGFSILSSREAEGWMCFACR